MSRRLGKKTYCGRDPGAWPCWTSCGRCASAPCKGDIHSSRPRPDTAPSDSAVPFEETIVTRFRFSSAKISLICGAHLLRFFSTGGPSGGSSFIKLGGISNCPTVSRRAPEPKGCLRSRRARPSTRKILEKCVCGRRPVTRLAEATGRGTQSSPR
eukprot:scaffold878_cov271-Pinguiococcus_pyrenoidosus.AAC.63